MGRNSETPKEDFDMATFIISTIRTAIDNGDLPINATSIINQNSEGSSLIDIWEGTQTQYDNLNKDMKERFSVYVIKKDA